MTIEYVTVYTANGQMEAEMIRALLETEGLHPIINQESAGIALGLSIGRLGEALVMVPSDEEGQATQIIDALEEGELVLPEEDSQQPSSPGSEENDSELKEGLD